MRSKTSYFSKFLYFKTLQRFWPVWVITSIGGCILSFILVQTDIYRYVHDVNFSKKIFITEATAVFPWVTFLYAIVVAMCTWSYMYHKNSNYSYHSYPISKTGLFVTHYLAGISMMVIPFAIAAILQVIMMLTLMPVSASALLYSLATVLSESILFYSLATFTAFVTSNIVALPILYMVFNFLMEILKLTTTSLARNAYPGVSNTISDSGDFLSPIIWIADNIDFYFESLYFEENGRYKISFCEPNNSLALLWLTLAGAVLSAIAYRLYCSKKNEDVGIVVSVNWMRPILLAVFVYTAALCGGELTWFISIGFDSSYYLNLPFIIILFILFGTIAYYVGLMLYAKTTRVFSKKSFIGVAVIALFFTVVTATIGNDWFNIVRSVPEQKDVKEVYLYIGGNEYIISADTNPDLIYEVVDLNKALAEDSVYLKNFGKIMNNEQSEINWTTSSANIKYSLNDGKTIEKYYKMVITEDRITNPETYDYKLSKLINEKEMILERYFLTSKYEIDSIYLIGAVGEQEASGIDRNRFKEELVKDVMENNALREEWFEAYEYYETTVEMDMLPVGSGPDDWRNRRWVNIGLKEEMTNTVNYMEECGVDLGYIRLDGAIYPDICNE